MKIRMYKIPMLIPYSLTINVSAYSVENAIEKVEKQHPQLKVNKDKEIIDELNNLKTN